MFVFWCLLFGASAHASSLADITEVGIGARPLGMGRAFNSIADDGSAIFLNPAGLAGVKKFDVLSMSGNMLGEIPYVTLGGAWKTAYGVIGLGYVNASVSGIREAILVGSTPEVTGNEASYGNTTMILSYANEAKNINYLNNLVFLTERNAKVGANLKLVNHGFSGGASFEGGTGSGFDLDIGTLIPVNDNVNASFIVRNIIPGNNVKNDELPLAVSGGFAYKLAERNLLTAVDAEINNGAFLLHLGAEWNPADPLLLRAGLDQAANGFNLAFGVGTRFRGFTFDYAYHTYAELSEFSTHFFSLGYIGE